MKAPRITRLPTRVDGIGHLYPRGRVEVLRPDPGNAAFCVERFDANGLDLAARWACGSCGNVGRWSLAGCAPGCLRCNSCRSAPTLWDLTLQSERRRFRAHWPACSRRSDELPLQTVECATCGELFAPKRQFGPHKRRFCGQTCRIRAEHRRRRGRPESDRAMDEAGYRRGIALPDGTTRINEHGYVEIKQDGRWQLEHRLIMEDHIGRPLIGNENVHHINGDRADNRLENLELWSTSQPSGQRVADKIAWARELLKLHGLEVTGQPPLWMQSDNQS